MKYEKIVTGNFIERPNRFIAVVDIDGEKVKVHVKNTGRCRELLLPKAKVYLEDFCGRMNNRKLRYSMIGVEKNTDSGVMLVNMDSNAPNKVVFEGLTNGLIKLEGMGNLKTIKAEKTFGNSRFDFYVEDEENRQAFIEVKGVTLENGGIASFPDAPTERGVKHVNELIKARESGYNAYIIFVIQMKGMKEFRPNDKTHRDFGEALRKAERQGVKILSFECIVTEDFLRVSREVEVNLQYPVDGI